MRNIVEPNIVAGDAAANHRVELAGGRPAAFAFLNALNLVDLSNNLGDTRSLSCHPTTTTHRVLSEDAGLSAARLGLALAIRNVLASGLGLLGISAPERM